ncbi:MAG: tyrosine-type recombinase/integrase [Candidatus Dormibacter sp.]
MPRKQTGGLVAASETAFSRLVADYLQDRRAGGASAKTVAIYADALNSVLLPFCATREVSDPAQLDNRVLNDLGAGLLDGTLSRTGRPLSKATVHSYMRAVNTFVAWANGQAGESITAKARLPTMARQVLDVLSRDEVIAMEDAATTERDKLIVRLLFETGIRLGELLALTGDDLQTTAGRSVLVVRHGKGDRGRLVPVTPALARRLRRFADRGRRGAHSDRLFLGLKRRASTGEYEPLTKSGAEQMIRNLAASAGISKRVYPHLLRHSMATDYLRRAGNPILLQQILGHTSLAMITQTYQHLTFGDAHDELMRVLLGDARR